MRYNRVCIMPAIVLSTLNAKYIHAAFGLRYLLANLGPAQPEAKIMEFDIHQRPVDVAEALLAQEPRIIGLGVYIWNVAPMTEVVAILKRVRPELVVIIGGPEVSYETDHQEIARLADYVITGEADFKFAELCRQLLDGARPSNRVLAAEIPQLENLQMPYAFYTDEDAARRIIYVEASRGCPFSCEFCLSSLDIPVRQFPIEPLLVQLKGLFDRGVRQFKFVDRTFNLNLKTSSRILEFFLDLYQPGLFVHFEMVPDRLPEGLRTIIARFPSGALQFEIGIQTFNPEVARLISRRQDYEKLSDNLRFLREQTGVHIHADLIAGLPGETLESFGAGFDRLVALRPQEIQVGILKRLRGTPIVRHDGEWMMVYNHHPPYEILRNKLIDFATMQRVRRFARYWDLVANSGNFPETTPLIWNKSDSPFAGFLRWSDWLYAQAGRQHAISLLNLAESLFRYLTTELKQPAELAAKALWRDYQRGGRSDTPVFLRDYLADEASPSPLPARLDLGVPKRQARHLAHAVKG